jgi:hypothetical protein
MLWERDLAEVTLPVALKSERKTYREYYDEELAARVGETYAADIERFGYSF